MPQHQPTDRNRKTVEAMAAYGVPEIDIARVVGIGPGSLRKHYREELDVAHAKANAKVAERLFETATKGEGREAVTAMIFWLKTRAKWREADRLEVTGKDGGPIDAKVVVKIDGRLAKL